MRVDAPADIFPRLTTIALRHPEALGTHGGQSPLFGFVLNLPVRDRRVIHMPQNDMPDLVQKDAEGITIRQSWATNLAA